MNFEGLTALEEERDKLLSRLKKIDEDLARLRDDEQRKALAAITALVSDYLAHFNSIALAILDEDDQEVDEITIGAKDNFCFV